jgi:hypothetical protein
MRSSYTAYSPIASSMGGKSPPEWDGSRSVGANAQSAGGALEGMGRMIQRSAMGVVVVGREAVMIGHLLRGGTSNVIAVALSSSSSSSLCVVENATTTYRIKIYCDKKEHVRHLILMTQTSV